MAADGGGGGTCLPTVRKNSPVAPSGVQLQIPILPFGLSTRAISPAATSWRGANIQPKTESTTSKLSSANGNASASPSIQLTSTPASVAKAPRLEQLGREIQPHDPASGLRCADRCVPGSAGDVENVRARAHTHAIDDVCADPQIIPAIAG